MYNNTHCGPTYLGGEIPLELAHTLQPIGSSLLTDKLYVEERALPRSKVVAGGGTTHDTGGHVGHYVLYYN